MLENIRKILKPNTAALITSQSGRRYLSGFEASDGFMVVTENSAAFFADSRYFEAAQKQIKNIRVYLFNGLKGIKEYLEKRNIDSVYIEASEVSLSALKNYRKALSLRVSESEILSKTLSESRMVKRNSEIENIISAQKITDAAFSHILNFIKAGVTEKQVALELELFMRKMGSEGVAFDTIAVSGKNSSLPHGVPTEKEIEKGDFVTLDFGAVINGYRSDMTRTVAVGYVTEEQNKVYETVLKAQLAAMDEIRAGKTCSDIDKTARDIIDSAGYKGAFGHALGHSVGLDIHEYPNFSPKCKEVLRENMVLSVEPGIYLPDRFGVRIEDLIVVKQSGIINLTNSNKELTIL